MAVESELKKRSPIDIMLEIRREVYPLPEPPEDEPWLNKTLEELTDQDKKAHSDFMIECQRVIAYSPSWIPQNHPRYNEYESAMREYESWFKLSAKDLLTEFTI